MTTPTIRVLVADDHPVVREGLRKMISLTDDIEVVGEAADGEDAVAMVAAMRPHVVLMDVRMPGMDGVEATKQIRTDTPATEVIVLSNYDEDRYVFDALRAGAKSYLLKDASPERLADAIRSVARGESTLDSGVISRVVSEFQSMGTRGLGVGQRLTARELEIVQCLVDGRSNQETADVLVVSEKTVKSHLTSIYRKLEVRGRGQAIVVALRDGLVTVPAGPSD
jgi:DNA-binding NarL/FixJ family response regulator